MFLTFKYSGLLATRYSSKAFCYNGLKSFSSTVRKWNQIIDEPSAVVAEKNVQPSPPSSTPGPDEYGLKDLKATGQFSDVLLEGLDKAKFRYFTPVQQASMLPILSEQGLVVRAKTGTGKTLAFAIPTIQNAINDRSKLRKSGKGRISTLIIVPTRDLAHQIYEEYYRVTRHFPKQYEEKTRTQVITGGKKTMLDHKFPKNIIVATPGRLLDKLSNARDAEMFAKIDYRIYDEADRLLDIGFEEELSKIDTILREVRQKYNPEAPEFKTVLFSATVDDNVSRFAKDQIGNDYKFINCVNENEPEAHENIHQTLVTCDNSTQVFESAISFILNNMEKPNFKAMVFLPTIAATEWFFTALSTTKRTDLYDSNLVGRQYRSQILRLHGKRTQVAREKTVKLFRHLDHGVLICTDVAARGLDLSGVSHVIQLNPSSELADYIHKVGRTARAGQKGEAITFLTKDELNYVKQLQKQRGVKFAVEMSGSDIPVVENILERVKVDDHIIDQMIGSYLSFQGQVTRVYRLNESKIIPSLMELYRKLLSSPEAKLTLSSKAAGMFRVNYDIKDEYFDYPQDRFSRRSGGDHQQKSDRYNKFNSDGGYQSKSRGYADRDGSSSYGHKSQSYGHSEGNSSYGHRESRGDSYNSGGYNKPRNNNYGNKSNYGGDRERSSRSNYNSGDRSSRSNYKSGDRKGSYSNDRRGNRQSQFDL